MMARKTPAETILNEMQRDLAEWMEAKEDMVWRPPLEMAKERDEFVARTLVPGFDPNCIEILISPDAILVRGETDRGGPGHRRLKRFIPFPRPINPDTVHAAMIDGMLSVRAEIARGSKVLEFVPRAA